MPAARTLQIYDQAHGFRRVLLAGTYRGHLATRFLHGFNHIHRNHKTIYHIRARPQNRAMPKSIRMNRLPRRERLQGHVPERKRHVLDRKNLLSH